jgi:hypothetical protein
MLKLLVPGSGGVGMDTIGELLFSQARGPVLQPEPHGSPPAAAASELLILLKPLLSFPLSDVQC